ncbi:hypothetical protein ES705_45557 [subsurface metagenome]
MNDFIERVDRKMATYWKWITESLFQNEESEFSRSQIWFQRFAIISIYLLCIVLWSFFLNWGRINWGVQDWIWEWRYSRILKEAVTDFQIPLHTDPPLSYGVSRFLGIPDVPLAPQIFLLRYLDPGLNFLINLLIMFSVSYIGCLQIKRHYQLSVFSFTILALLFNVNGFITSHIAAGHTFFTGYFLLPFYILLTLQLMEGKASKYWYAQMGLVLFGIELVGTTHIFAICFMFLGVLLLFAKSDRPNILKSMVAGVALNIYRLAPAALALTAMEKPPFAGFTTLGDLIIGLVWIIPPSKSIVGLPIAWWEFDMYVGVLGLAFILFFGIKTIWRSKRDSQTRDPLRPLVKTMLVFSVFSIGYLYMPINYLPIPLFNLIHVPSRFLILPLLFIIAMATTQIQSWLDRRSSSSWSHFSLILLLAILGHDLFQHARLWRIEYVFEAFSSESLDFSLHIANQIDPAYIIVLAVSWTLSLMALAYILWRMLRDQSRSPS